MMRLDVVNTGRRRRWSEAEKQRIIAESFSGPRLVAATARRNGVSRSLLTTWRRLHRRGCFVQVPERTWQSFASVGVTAEPQTASVASVSELGRVEIVLCNDRRLIIGAGMDASALAQLIAVVERA